MLPDAFDTVPSPKPTPTLGGAVLPFVGVGGSCDSCTPRSESIGTVWRSSAGTVKPYTKSCDPSEKPGVTSIGSAQRFSIVIHSSLSSFAIHLVVSELRNDGPSATTPTDGIRPESVRRTA